MAELKGITLLNINLMKMLDQMEKTFLEVKDKSCVKQTIIKKRTLSFG